VITLQLPGGSRRSATWSLVLTTQHRDNVATASPTRISRFRDASND